MRLLHTINRFFVLDTVKSDFPVVARKLEIDKLLNKYEMLRLTFRDLNPNLTITTIVIARHWYIEN